MHAAYLKLASSSLVVLQFVAGEECVINAVVSRIAANLQFDLTGLSGVSFVGVKPKVTHMPGEPMLKILGYSMETEPTVNVRDGKLVVSHSSCSLLGEGAVEATSIASKVTSNWQFFLCMAVALVSTSSECLIWGILSSVLLLTGVTSAQALTCQDIVEVEIYSPNVIQLPSLVQVPSSGAHYMESDINWPYYDGSNTSLHFEAEPTWSADVEAVRAFRDTESGGVYNYR